MIPYPIEISPDVELVRDVQYGLADGAELRMDVARLRERKEGDRLPAIVYFHGGAWQSGSKEDGVPAICYYAQYGFVAASVDYRLSGVARFPAQIEDCRCAVRFLRANAAEYGIDPERIGAMGASSGGHLAALLGLTGDEGQFADKGGWEGVSSGVSAVCDLFGPSDFPRMPRKSLPDAISATAQFLGGSIDDVPEVYVKASLLSHVHAGAPPFLIIHGAQDPVVPLSQSELLRDALLRAGAEVEFHAIERAGHGSREVVNPEVRGWILRFFEGRLGKAL